MRKVTSVKLTNGDELLLLDAQIKDGFLRAKAPMALGINPSNGHMTFMPYVYTAKEEVKKLEVKISMDNVVIMTETDEEIVVEYLKVIKVDKPIIQTLNG